MGTGCSCWRHRASKLKPICDEWTRGNAIRYNRGSIADYFCCLFLGDIYSKPVDAQRQNISNGDDFAATTYAWRDH